PQPIAWLAYTLGDRADQGRHVVTSACQHDRLLPKDGTHAADCPVCRVAILPPDCLVVQAPQARKDVEPAPAAGACASGAPALTMGGAGPPAGEASRRSPARHKAAMLGRYARPLPVPGARSRLRGPCQLRGRAVRGRAPFAGPPARCRYRPPRAPPRTGGPRATARPRLRLLGAPATSSPGRTRPAPCGRQSPLPPSARR